MKSLIANGCLLTVLLFNSAESGSWEQSLRSAKVIRKFDTGGLPIGQVQIERNTIAAGLRSGEEEQTIVVWDTSGNELFRIPRRDTSLPVDNGHGQWPSLSDVSDDGSTFAIHQAWVTTLCDRNGDSLASFQSQPQGLLSPNGEYWIPKYSYEDYECGFELYSRFGTRLIAPAFESEGYWSGTFLSDSRLMAFWTTRGISMSLPSLTVDEFKRPSFADDHEVYSPTPSPTGSVVAIRGIDLILILDSLGSVIRTVQSTRPWPIAFDPQGKWLGMLEQRGRSNRLVLASIADSMADVWTAPIPYERQNWKRLALFPSPDTDAIRVLLSSPYENLTFGSCVSLSTGEMIEAFDLPAEYIPVPGEPNRFVRLVSDSGDEKMLRHGPGLRFSVYDSSIELIEISE